MGGVPAMAQTLTQAFPHSLGVGTSAQSYEHRIDLPEDWASKNVFFVKRTLVLTGKMVIEHEELTPNYYFVKVRLPKAWLLTAKGSLSVTLDGGQPPSVAFPDACTGLRVGPPATKPRFSWAGLGKYTAVSLLDKGTGKTVWERVILGKCDCEMDEGSLGVGHRYLWAVKQSTEAGRYSPEAQGAFKIGVTYERCVHCMGTGWIRCAYCNGTGGHVVTGPNGQSHYQICGQCGGSGRERCSFCLGTGQVEVPVIIPE